MKQKVQETLDAINERLLQAEADIDGLKSEKVALLRRLEKVEPKRPCPGARMMHYPGANWYCEECQG